MACQFFICYAMEENRRQAEAVRALFVDCPGVTCWMAPGSIPPGEPFHRAIQKGIKASDVFVVVFSKAADDSEDVASEIELAREYKKRIVPVRVADDKPENLGYFLRLRNWVELHGSDEDRAAGEKALRDLALEVRGPQQEAPQDPPPQVEAVTSVAPDTPAEPLPSAVASSAPPGSQAPAPRRRKPAAAAPVRQRRLKDPEEEYARLQKQLEQQRGVVEKQRAESAQRTWDLAASYCRRTKPDFALARQTFASAAAAGKKDGQAERRLYEQGAAAGSIDAMVSLAMLLESGARVSKDVAYARTLYEKAAEADNADAMCRLGVMAMNGIPNGTPNYGMAQTWLRQAAALGHADAMWEMGNWFKCKHDEQNAKLWYDKARARRRAQSRNKAPTTGGD